MGALGVGQRRVVGIFACPAPGGRRPELEEVYITRRGWEQEAERRRAHVELRCKVRL